jgi:hypothetical protein
LPAAAAVADMKKYIQFIRVRPCVRACSMTIMAMTSVASFPFCAACIHHLGSVWKMYRLVLTMCNGSWGLRRIVRHNGWIPASSHCKWFLGFGLGS